MRIYRTFAKVLFIWDFHACCHLEILPYPVKKENN